MVQMGLEKTSNMFQYGLVAKVTSTSFLKMGTATKTHGTRHAMGALQDVRKNKKVDILYMVAPMTIPNTQIPNLLPSSTQALGSCMKWHVGIRVTAIQLDL